MSEFSSCSKCTYESGDQVAYCSRCGGPMVSSVKLRREGWLLAIVGSILVVFMGFIIIWEVRGMLPGSETRYTGTTEDAAYMFIEEGDLVVVALLCIWNGAWQIKYGKRNNTLRYLTIGLGGVFLLMVLRYLAIHPP